MRRGAALAWCKLHFVEFEGAVYIWGMGYPGSVASFSMLDRGLGVYEECRVPFIRIL